MCGEEVKKTLLQKPLCNIIYTYSRTGNPVRLEMNSMLNGSCVAVYSLSHVGLAASQTVACQAPLFMGFPRQANRSGLPFPSPGESS